MGFRRISHFSLLAAVVMFAAGLCAFAQNDSHARGRKYKPPPPTSRVQVTIVRDEDAKPIENAAVIWHLVGDKGNMELKTDEDGKSTIDVLPTGSEVLLQVIAKGYQTYGADYKLEKAQMAIEVKLKRPGGQYSIYEKHENAEAGKDADQDKKKDSGKDSSQKDASKDKPSDSGQQNNSQPDSNQPQQK
ncbi:MAG TPA: carboxypeptidase-like regulatory domain-containing protein [Terracidiphilus sp.]|nr:carboxypeptidase-like regulatory domain-containing protein [Terracidiphilus sp.]